jgi:alkanesulfonate monooxygenase SsuD/methylene tetrahydromethanopterin reductase-like flavin-dependent oxidoreductase (luciferase family)
MEFGVVLPQNGPVAEVLAFARDAEAAGFDSVWVVDHVLNFPPQEGIHEAWTIKTAVAAVTERIGVGAQVLCQSFRNPALLAKMATTLDLVANGRLRFLIGAGWMEPEYDAYNWPFPPPGQRFEELRDAVRICRGMWDAGVEPFTYDGTHYSVAGAFNTPPPERRIPIGLGGGGDRMLNLAAAEADEWNCPGILLGNYAERLRRIEECDAKHGRKVRRSLQIVFHPGESEMPPQFHFFSGPLGLVGSADQMIERANELKAQGVEALYGVIDGRRGLEAMAAELAGVRAAVS